ncbi:hypothetical protein AB0H45_33950 [Streptomyces atroolivaceus]|uniref:hypothetical protein n=1 Tax=Streptomyces atroolivaceus TaxID=66869 RepID=UPI0033E3A56D
MDHIHQAAVETQGDVLANLGAKGDGRLPERDNAVLGGLAIDFDDGRGRQGCDHASRTAVSGSNAVPHPHDKRRADAGRTRHRAGPF